MNAIAFLALSAISLIGLLFALVWLVRRIKRSAQLLPWGIRWLLHRWQTLVELSAIIVWAMWIGRAYFNFDPLAWPFGSEVGLSVQSYFVWQNVAQCGDCVFWNGSLNGGAPAFVELHGATLHPLVVIPTMLWGAVNGIKIAIVGSLAMAGIAQWWLAKALHLSMVPRLWSAALAVVGGHLAGRMSNGVIGLVISTAACSLIIAPAIELAETGHRRATVKLGLMLGLALLAGQGYLQIAAVMCLLPTALIFAIGRGSVRAMTKELLYAGVLAIMIAAVLIVPLAHFWPNFAKDVDLSYSTAQPLEYVPLNLVIRDAEFLASTQLGKAPIGYLYAAFIGWTPILLSIAAVCFAPRTQRRQLVYILVTTGLLIFMASALPLKFLRDTLALGFLSAVRYPSLMLGLAVPLIVGLAAWGLDLCLTRLRSNSIMAQSRRAHVMQFAALSLKRLAIGAILIASIQVVLDYSDAYLGLVPAPKNADQLIGELQTPTAQWVSPPYGEGYWSPLALAAGLKINVWRPWSWLGRTNPPAYYATTRHAQDVPALTLVKTLLGINILRDPANEYAQLDSGSRSIPCQATATGGHINVDCESDASGTLIVHENNWDGWIVSRNGQLTSLGSSRWLTTEAPAGRSHFEFRYRPWDAPLGIVVTVLGLVLACLWWIKSSGTRRTPGKPIGSSVPAAEAPTDLIQSQRQLPSQPSNDVSLQKIGDSQPVDARPPSALRQWWQTHWREVAIVLGLIVFGLFMWFSSPPADVDRPDPTSLPFDLLLPARQFMLEQAPNAGPIILIGGAVVLAGLWLVALPKKRTRPALSATLLIIAVLIALYGQVQLMTEFVEQGTQLYLLAAGLMLIWVLWQRPFRAPSGAKTDRVNDARFTLPYRTELILVAIVMVITVFARTYEIKRMPYGVDGDEANWTIDLIGSKIDEQDTSSSLYHYRNLPMSFWMQTPFHWVLGPGLMPGRIEVIVFSILASFIFYLLVRELFDVPTALVATLLLAVALPDLSASRTGNIQAHFKIWAILPMFGAAVALRTRRPWHFFLTGLALAGGMLTYESLLPVVAAVGSFVGLTVLIDLIRHRTQWKAWLPRLGAFAVAPLPVGSFAMLYLVGRGQYYEDFRRAGEGLGLGELITRGFSGVFASFYRSPLNDALYARGGPYINGLLVPLLVLGIVLAVGTLTRKRGSALTLMWLVWVFFSVPVFLPGPLPRLYYSGLPALYIFIACLLLALYRAIANVIRKPAVTLPIALVLLGSFTVLELTIWFQEPQTTEDANMRRELAELVSRNVYPTDLLLIPIDPLGGEPLKVEQRVMQLFIRERYRVMDYGEFRQVALDKLLPTIALEGQRYRTIRVLHDMMQDPVVAHRQEIIEALRRCYPTSLKQRTSHFELYEINTTELTFATCRSTVLTIGPLPASVPANQPVTLNWSLDSIPASNADLTCWRSRPDVIWFEAEQMTQLAGWKAENTLSLSAPWTGDGYLVDDFPERVEAAHDIPLAVGGRYTIWVRTYRRQPDNFPAFLDVKGQTYTLADSSLGLDEWKWQKLDTIELVLGTLPVKLWRAFDRTQAVYFSLLIDSIVLTTDPEFDPAQSERWLPARQRGESFPNKAMHGAFELTLEPGQYRCQIVTRDADRLVDVTGQLGLTRMLEFEATPQ